MTAEDILKEVLQKNEIMKQDVEEVFKEVLKEIYKEKGV